MEELLLRIITFIEEEPARFILLVVGWTLFIIGLTAEDHNKDNE